MMTDETGEIAMIVDTTLTVGMTIGVVIATMETEGNVVIAIGAETALRFVVLMFCKAVCAIKYITSTKHIFCFQFL